MLNLIILQNSSYCIFNVKSIRIYVYIFSNSIEILLKMNLFSRWSVSVISESRFILVGDSSITANGNLSVNQIIIRIYNRIKKNQNYKDQFASD
jgi:hypothetical protein